MEIKCTVTVIPIKCTVAVICTVIVYGLHEVANMSACPGDLEPGGIEIGHYRSFGSVGLRM
jgi:hypothetical protein